jgi:hypothetical protein
MFKPLDSMTAREAFHVRLAIDLDVFEVEALLWMLHLNEEVAQSFRELRWSRRTSELRRNDRR